jgi:hypothetical protein
MREWPSIVPGAPEDYYIVINHYGEFGPAFAETDLDSANYETTIADLMNGQHSDPLRVVMFNPDTDRAEDVSHAIAQEILRRLDLEGCNVPSKLEDFIDRHVGRDRQPDATAGLLTCAETMGPRYASPSSGCRILAAPKRDATSSRMPASRCLRR